ncbi:MAG TPA: hypothetical protein VE035_04015, partial [Puia sp.]|nr:hypothetical protein [Puia sp.]
LKGDLQQFYFWIDQASRTIPRNGDDSARILVLRLIKKARTKGVKIADLDFLADSLNSITISDPTFEIRLHIMLATVYSQFKAVDKMDKALQFVWDKGAAEDKLSGFALLKEEYTNNGDEEAADSINDICVARAKIALASHNTSINRLLLDKFLLDKAIYRSVNGLDEDMDDDDDDEVNTTAVDSSFNTLMGEFLRSPDWISEMVVITALTNYHQAILQHSDSSFVFYNNMLTDLRGIGRKYDASLLRSLAYAALVNYYNLEEKEGPCISNFINCIKSAVIKAKDNPMYQYYLSTILTETVINDDYLKNQDCQRGVRQALDYYWQYDDHRNFMSPVIVSSYILTFNIKDEISLLKVFNQFSENLPDRIEEEMYWESYIKFMDYAFAVLLRSGNKVLLNQILGDNLRLHATKLAKQLNTTYNKGNITNYLNKAVYLSIKLKLAGGKTRTANEFLMQTIDAAAERFRKDSSYKPVLKELFLNSIPHLMLAEWRADTTSYSLWKANITRYEQSYTDTIMRSCLHISAYRIRWINAVGTSDSLKGLAAGQKDLAIRTDLELSALHILLDSSLVFPKHYTGMNIDPAVYSVTDKITSSYSSIVQLFILRNNADKAIMYARSYIEKDSNNNIAQLSLAAAEMYGGDTTGATARFHKALASMNLLNSTKYLSDYLDPYVKAGIDKGQAMTLITQLKTMQDIEEARKKQAPQREQPKDDSIIHVGNLIIVKNPTNP